MNWYQRVIVLTLAIAFGWAIYSWGYERGKDDETIPCGRIN